MIEELLAQSLTQWIALISGIAYVVLAAREKMLCWVFGIISCACIALDDFTSFNLYADGVLQIIYIGFGVLGLYRWLGGMNEQDKARIHYLSIHKHVIAISLALLISWPVSWILQNYTIANYGFLDTVTTILSLWATWLLVNKAISNWIYWIVIDMVYVYLFARTGGTLVAVLYFIFLFASVYGFVEWRKRILQEAIIKTESK